MTDKQALKKAVALLGKNATVNKGVCCTKEFFVKQNGEKAAFFWERYFGKMRYTVGVLLYGCINEIKGTVFLGRKHCKKRGD